MNTTLDAISQIEETEKVVLAAILLDPDAWYEASAITSGDDFTRDWHRHIWLTIAAMVDEGSPVDTFTLQQTLQAKGELHSVGGAAYLADLTTGVPRRLNVAVHAKKIRRAAQQRQVIELCTSAAERARIETPEDIALSVWSRFEQIFAGEEDDAAIEKSMVTTLDRFHEERKLSRSPGLSYGIENLDRFTGGMRKGEVTVVGARSGVGKTSLACQAFVANASRGIPCALFSLEMTREQINQRLISIVSGVPYRHVVNSWEATQEEADKVTRAGSLIVEWPALIHDAEDLTLARMLALGRIAIRRHKTRLLIVDYAQEVDAPGKDERTKVMLTCRKLTQLVKHEDCSLMLLSQLVKMSRENYGKPPIVSDLVESGKLENVAHCVILLHRGWDEVGRRIAEDAELIVPKQRRGETGVLRARFNRITATFEDL